MTTVKIIGEPKDVRSQKYALSNQCTLGNVFDEAEWKHMQEYCILPCIEAMVNDFKERYKLTPTMISLPGDLGYRFRQAMNAYEGGSHYEDDTTFLDCKVVTGCLLKGLEVCISATTLSDEEQLPEEGDDNDGED